MDQVPSLQQQFLRELQNIQDIEALLFGLVHNVLTHVPVQFVVDNNELFICSLVDDDTFSRDRRPLVCNQLQSEHFKGRENRID